MLDLYKKLMVANLRSQMQYKTNFLINAVTNAALMVLDFLLLAAILLRFDDVKGWNLYEIGLLYGVTSAGMALYRIFSVEIHEFEKYIVNGEFDQLLTRPVSPLFLLLTRRVDLGRIGGFAQGIGVLIFSLVQLFVQGKASLLLLLYMPIAILLGAILFFSISLVTATSAFWTTQVKDLQVFTLYAPANAGSYPISLYPAWLKSVFLGLLPVGFIVYIPALYLLGKGGSWFNLLLAPAVVLLYFAFSLWFWRFGIKFYHSTGS
ncbi:MAG: ABC transporter permease [Clostridia bacterium]